MKIALVGRFGESDVLSGPERVARELLSELKNKNIQVVFIEYFFDDYRDSSFFHKVFGKRIFEDHSLMRLGILTFIITLLKNRYNIIHIVNGQRFLLFLLLLNRIIPGKIITTFHGSIKNEQSKSINKSKRQFVDVWVEKLSVTKSDMLIFPSILLQKIFNEYYRLKKKNFQIIPNGVNETFRTPVVKKLDLGNSFKVVFYNGPENSFDRGLKNLVHLLSKVDGGIELFVLGRSEEINIRNKNINISFNQLLSHEDLINFLSDKHFVIKSNYFDSFSIFIAECMCLGVIPIINNNIGICELIEDKSNGFIYSGYSAEELKDLFNEISEEKYNLDIMSSNAKKVFEKINWQRVTEHYIDAYKSAL